MAMYFPSAPYCASTETTPVRFQLIIFYGPSLGRDTNERAGLGELQADMIYKLAAKYLDGGAGTLRNRVYNDNKESVAKQIYALVSQTLKYRQVIAHLIKSSNLLKYEKKLSNEMAMLMVHDLVLSKSKKLMCGQCPEKQAVLRHKVRLNGELVKFKVKFGPLKEETNETPVRWVRCNPAKSNPEALEEFFQAKGLVPVETHAVHEKSYYIDPYVDGLFGIHPSFPVVKSELYKNGSLIIQDRASCFPVAIIQPKNTCTYMDACSAPGNKTTLLAAQALKVHAFERDKKRAKTLEKMISVAGLGPKVDVNVQDFTLTDPSEFEVEGLIVDPSCSGSGIFGRSSLEQEHQGEKRLEKLADFQYIIMKHALRFDAQVVVYSTCSVHAIENEQVVRKLLETPEVAAKWKLRDRSQVLEGWPRRGHAPEFAGMENSEDLADSCVRVEPLVDGGIGFFAACFERI